MQNTSPLAREVIAGMSGLEILQAMLSGAVPPPPFALTTRIYPTVVDAGVVTFEGEPNQDFLNPLGTVHGGWIAALLDSAMACAVHSRIGAGQTYTTLEMKVNFVRAVTGKTGRVRCEGRVLHFGSQTATAEGRVTDMQGRLIAHGTETCIIAALRPTA
jgi:uncharacterized protein (TIGR00369 family)